MNAELEQWLSEVRREGIAFADDFGGADQNLWCLSLPRASMITADDLVAFVLAAVAIRRELVATQSVAPVSFYVWHDEMAGQLRFSTARCTLDSLPFSAAVRLVPQVEEIVQAFLASPYRNGIPWTAIRAGTDDAQASGPDTRACGEPLQVWAQRLA